MIVEHDSIGIYLSVLATGNEDSEIILLLSLVGHHTPSDAQCGEDRFRCNNQLILRNTALNNNSSLILVPLNNALLLVTLVSNETHLTMQEYHLINMTNYNCSPINTLKIASSIYTICVNLETQPSYISLFEIRLNRESLSQSFTVGPLAQNHFEMSANLQLSEFKYAPLYNFHFIYFAISNYLYYFEPLNYDLDYLGELPRNCTSVKELVYIGDDTLLVHCNNQAVVYFNLAYQQWTQYRSYSEYGRPYTCQENDVNNQIIVFPSSSHIQRNYGSRELNNTELLGENFLSGECFGQSTGFYFVYMDEIEGTFVLDLSTFNLTHLTTQACNDSSHGCTPIRVLDNRYLVVQHSEENKTSTIEVFDSKSYFGRIRALSNTNKSLSFLAAVTDTNSIDRCSITTDAAPISHTTTDNSVKAGFPTTTKTETLFSTTRDEIEVDNTNPNVQDSNEFIVGLVIGISVAGLLIIVLLVAAALIIIVVTCKLQSETDNNR